MTSTNDQATINYKRTAAEATPIMPTETKRPHTDVIASAVVLLSNLPIGATNAHVAQALAPFGTPVNIRNAGTNKMLVEMDSMDSSRAIMSTPQLAVMGYPISVQYSQYQKLLDVTTSANSAPACLIVRITNLGHALNLDILFQLFSRYGKVMRIVSFMKSNFLQVLLEMDSPASAKEVKDSLHNCNLYTGSCHTEVEFSKLTHVSVRQAGPRARDFVADPLRPGEQLSTAAINPVQPVSQFQQPMLPKQQQPQQHMTGYYNPQSNPMMGQSPFGANPFTMGYGGPQQTMPTSMGHVGCVVRVQNLSADIQLDQLFMLFGVYGDVMRIKQVHKDPTQALIQYASPQQGSLAISYLNGIKFLGCTLRVSQSKFPMVHLSQDSGQTKDYSKSKIHRFKNPKSLNHIHPPSRVLYLHRLHNNPSTDSVTQLFREIGVEPEGVKIFDSGKRMAFVQLRDVEEAAFCLVGLHNKLDQGSYIRVSFSRHNSLSDNANATNSVGL